MNKELITKSVIIILFVIIGSVILVKGLTGGQTLNDYAIENNIPVHSDTAEE